MEMIINVDALVKSDLLAIEYILFQAILEKNNEIIPKLLVDLKEAYSDKTTEDLLQQYETEGYIKIIADIKDPEIKWTEGLVVREKFLTLATPIKVKWFEELWDIFPYKVPSRGGTRPLRAEGIDSQNFKEAKRKYLSKVKSEVKHKDVILRLRTEISQREQTNTLCYMNNLLTWLNQSGWEKYEPEKQEINVAGAKQPGQEVY